MVLKQFGYYCKLYYDIFIRDIAYQIGHFCLVLSIIISLPDVIVNFNHRQRLSISEPVDHYRDTIKKMFRKQQY